MKRLIFNIFALLAMSLAVNAMPVLPGQWKMITLADGTQVKAEKCGDEFVTFWRTADGQKYQLAENGRYAVVKPETLAAQVKANRATLYTEDATQESRNMHKVSGEYRHEKFTGKKRCLCILVEFSDVHFTQKFDKTFFTNYTNGVNYKNEEYGIVGSVRDYFKAQSNGEFEVEFDVVGPYQLPYSRAYYGGNVVTNGKSTDKNAQAMAKAALNAADADVNYAQYDWDGDYYVEPVFILFAGQGEADGGSDDCIWPHKGQTAWTRKDNVYVGEYACGPELNGFDPTKPAGIGTMCHEYSHCLGYPDMYDIYYSGNEGTGEWDVMNSGSYLPDGKATTPCNYTAYERWWAGWLEYKELGKTPTEVKGMAPLHVNNEAYVMYNDAYKNEFFVLENRAKDGWDAGLPGEGLLIYHIDFNSDIWKYNYVNTTTGQYNDHQRCFLVSPDNSAGKNAVYPAAGSCFSNETSDGAMLFHPTLDRKYFLDNAITDIRLDEDGNISFKYSTEPLTYNEKPEGAIFYESFDHAYGFGGNDGSFVAEGTSGFAPDNDGWKGSVNSFCAGFQCARLGTSSAKGTVQTPTIRLNGTYHLSFLAAPCPGEAKRLVLTCTGMKFDQSTFTLKQGEWTKCETDITANANCVIKFVADSKRFFLDEVLITEGSADGIVGIETDSQAEGPAYNLAGQRVASDYKGVVISNGRKVLRK